MQCMINVCYDKCTTQLHHCISSLLFSSVMMLLMSVPVLGGVIDGFVHGKMWESLFSLNKTLFGLGLWQLCSAYLLTKSYHHWWD